jgi:Peptidase family S41/Tricorn protease C1 domain
MKMKKNIRIGKLLSGLRNHISFVRNPVSGIRQFALPLLFTGFFFGCEHMLLGPEPENTPKNNFEILWKTLDENYALFSVKNINWDSLHSVYGSKITASTSDSGLWDLFSGLIQCLNDGHVVLIDKRLSKIALSSEISKRKTDDFNLDLIKNKFLVNYKYAGGSYFTYGKVKSSLSSKSIGYIYISTFTASNRSNAYDWAYDIDKILQDLYDCDALIIDLRNNGGGLKNTGWIIASAFVDKEITYFYQQEKTGPGHNDFGKPIPLMVSPRKGVLAYTKKISLLTNRFSASGSEHFAQLFKFLPYAVQIGDTTFGCFGDIIGNSELPNG